MLKDGINNSQLTAYDSITIDDIKKWTEFVLEHPNGNIFQTPEYYNICKNTKLYEPKIILAKLNSEIVGLLLGNIQKVWSNKLGNYTARSVVIGGPLIKNNDSEVFNIVLNRYDQVIRKHTVYSEIRNLIECKDKNEVFQINGYKYEPHLNIIIDLTKSDDELWKGIDRRARNRIRAAIKNGIIFKIENNLSGLESCYNIIKRIYSRIGLPVAQYDYFINMYDTMIKSDQEIIIFTSQYNKKIIGFLLAIGYKETLYCLYNGADYEYYDKYPNDFISWEIILWAKNNGYKKYDWLGAGRPGNAYGVRNFKIKYGGELIELGRYEKVNRPLLFKVCQYAIRIKQELRNKGI